MVKFDDYDMEVMEAVVNDLPEEFDTFDVSDDSRMLEAHQRVIKDRNYRAFVGKLLKNSERGLGLEQITPATQSPARWRR